MPTIAQRLRQLESTRFVRWCLLTVFSFCVNVGLAVGLHEGLGVPEEIAFLVSLTTVFVTNFLIMRHYVYRSAQGGGRRQFTLFALSSLAFRGGEWAAFYIADNAFQTPFLPTIIGVLLLSFVVKYFYYGLVVFVHRGGKPAADNAAVA